MDRNERIVLAACAFAAVLAAGLGFGWPWYVSVPLAVVLPVVAVLVHKQVHDRREQIRLRELYAEKLAAAPPPPPPPPQPLPNEEPLSDVLLPSADPDYRLVFSCKIYWHHTKSDAEVRHADPRSLAVDTIISRSTDVTRTADPADHVRYGHRLAAVLGAQWPDRSGQVVAWAEEVTLTLTDDDERRLRKLSELRKNEQVWDHERNFERNVRRYLAEDVLKNTGSAVVWWLARHIDKVEETERLIGTLARVTAAANNTDVQPLYQQLVAEAKAAQGAYEPEAQLSLLAAGPGAAPTGNGVTHGAAHAVVAEPDARSAAQELADRLFADPDDTRRSLFADHIAGVVERFGGERLADEIRMDFDLPIPEPRERGQDDSDSRGDADRP